LIVDYFGGLPKAKWGKTMRNYIVLAIASFVGACASGSPIEPVAVSRPVAYIVDSGDLRIQPRDVADEYPVAEPVAEEERASEPSKPPRVYWFFGDHGG